MEGAIYLSLIRWVRTMPLSSLFVQGQRLKSRTQLPSENGLIGFEKTINREDGARADLVSWMFEPLNYRREKNGIIFL